MFSQITQSTIVTLVDQVLANDTSSTDGDTTADNIEQVPLVAGVDDLLEKLNQLIIEPISKRGVYAQYGIPPIITEKILLVVYR